MLIDSPRLLPADRAEWARLERYDQTIGASRKFAEMESDAIAEVRAFDAANSDWWISTSWGKDSVVSAHIALKAFPHARLMWARARHVETPECLLVRDAFLAVHPDARYEEREYDFRVPLRFEKFGELTETQDALNETLNGRYVSGVRAEESDSRRISLFKLGPTTKTTCRPIGMWKTVDVFAYMARENLPVHPVYGMVLGGATSRLKLRVHPLGTTKRRWGEGPRLEPWEEFYYKDVILAAIEARRHLWEPS